MHSFISSEYIIKDHQNIYSTHVIKVQSQYKSSQGHQKPTRIHESKKNKLCLLPKVIQKDTKRGSLFTILLYQKGLVNSSR